MPRYAYRATKPDGQAVTGLIEAATSAEAEKRLRNQGLSLKGLELQLPTRARSAQPVAAPLAEPEPDRVRPLLPRPALGALVVLLIAGAAAWWIKDSRTPKTYRVTLGGTLRLAGKPVVPPQGDHNNFSFFLPGQRPIVKKDIPIDKDGRWETTLELVATRPPRVVALTVRKRGYVVTRIRDVELLGRDPVRGTVPPIELAVDQLIGPDPALAKRPKGQAPRRAADPLNETAAREQELLREARARLPVRNTGPLPQLKPGKPIPSQEDPTGKTGGRK